MFGDNTAIRRRIGDLEHQVEGYHNDKDVHFSATEALKHLDKEKMAGILKIFGGKAISDQDKDYCMLITQHYINLNLMNYAEQKQLYTLLVDYFSDGLPLVVKPHPSDIHGLYQKWFPDATVLNRMCLTELLPYCGNIHYKTGICASSTSIYGLGEWMDETVCFTQEIEKTYRYMHQYYMALRCIAHLGVREGAKVYMMSGMNCEQFIGLNKHYHIIPDSMEKIDDYKQMANTAARRYVVIDDILKKGKKVDTCIEMLKMATSDDVLIFLNTKNKAFFVKERNLEVLKNIVPVAITVKEMQGGQQKREYVYIFSKNVRVREELMKMKEYKELKYTGVTVEVNQEEQTEVKVLEGINRALEARLNLVSNRYRQSKKELKIKCRESEEEIKSLRQENKKLKKYSLYGVKEAFLKK